MASCTRIGSAAIRHLLPWRVPCLDRTAVPSVLSPAPRATIVANAEAVAAAYGTADDATVFTMAQLAPPDLPVDRIRMLPPAIEPRSLDILRLPERAAAEVPDWTCDRAGRWNLRQQHFAVMAQQAWRQGYDLVAGTGLSGRAGSAADRDPVRGMPEAGHQARHQADARAHRAP